MDTNPGFLPFGFASGLYDRDTGLISFGARDYDPQTGRWISKYPIGFNGGINFYAYVNNNPINYIDQSGLDWIYSQSTGGIHYWGGMIPEYYGTGYAGRGEALNNPAMQGVENVGLLPSGFYTIGPMQNYTTTSGSVLSNAMVLTPFPTTDLLNRPGGFLIHGDNANGNQLASTGCIVLQLSIRNQINNSSERIL